MDSLSEVTLDVDGRGPFRPFLDHGHWIIRGWM